MPAEDYVITRLSVQDPMHHIVDQVYRDYIGTLHMTRIGFPGQKPASWFFQIYDLGEIGAPGYPNPTPDLLVCYGVNGDTNDASTYVASADVLSIPMRVTDAGPADIHVSEVVVQGPFGVLSGQDIDLAVWFDGVGVEWGLAYGHRYQIKVVGVHNRDIYRTVFLEGNIYPDPETSPIFLPDVASTPPYDTLCVIENENTFFTLYRAHYLEVAAEEVI